MTDNPFKLSANSTCNVCLKTGVRLTKDHVPPTGALGGRNPVRIRQPIAQLRLDRDPNAPPFIRSRTGVYFTTVCVACHRGFSNDDERLKEFVLAARRELAYPISRLGAIGVRAQSDAVVRSILGHNLTSRFVSDGNKFEQSIRSVVLGDASGGINLYVHIWRYWGDDVFLMHDFLALPWFKNLGSVLSFPPLTFFVCEGPLAGVQGMNVAESILRPKPYVVIDCRDDLTGYWPRDAGALMGGARCSDYVVAESAI